MHVIFRENSGAKNMIGNNPTLYSDQLQIKTRYRIPKEIEDVN